MYFGECAFVLGLFLLLASTLAQDKCDRRYCYYVVGLRVQMNDIKEVIQACHSSTPRGRLLSIEDADVQTSVEEFFVRDPSQFAGEADLYVPLALLLNGSGHLIPVDQKTASTPAVPASVTYSNWREGNPVLDISGSYNCVFFTPRESSRWWNSLCSSKTVTVICMRDQISFSTPSLSTRKSFQTPAVVKSTILIATASSAAAASSRFPAATTTTTSTSTTTSVVSTETSSTLTTTSSESTSLVITSPITDLFKLLSTLTMPSTVGVKNTTDQTGSSAYDKDKHFRENLAIGLGASIGLLFLICLVTVLVTHCHGTLRGPSKFSSVSEDVDRARYKPRDPEEGADADPESDDRGSSDSGFAVNESEKEEQQQFPWPVEEDDPPEAAARPEADVPLRSESADSGLDRVESLRLDWEDAGPTVVTLASKKSPKKVTFDLDHVVEIPN